MIASEFFKLMRDLTDGEIAPTRLRKIQEGLNLFGSFPKHSEKMTSIKAAEAILTLMLCPHSQRDEIAQWYTGAKMYWSENPEAEGNPLYRLKEILENPEMAERLEDATFFPGLGIVRLKACGLPQPLYTRAARTAQDELPTKKGYQAFVLPGVVICRIAQLVSIGQNVEKYA